MTIIVLIKINDFQYPRKLNIVCPIIGPPRNPSPLAALR
jgi:hypothetical protein